MDYTKDYYEILGLPHTATSDEIRSAFRSLALKYHPDRNLGDIQAEEKFKEISVAHDILSRPLEKNDFDSHWIFKSNDYKNKTKPESSYNSKQSETTDSWDNELNNNGYRKKKYSNEKSYQYTYQSNRPNENQQDNKAQPKNQPFEKHSSDTVVDPNLNNNETSNQKVAKIISLVFIVGIVLFIYLISQKL